MTVAVKVPAVGESVQEGMISSWHVKDGDYVDVDDVLVELDTDKASVEVVAETAGAITLKRQEGETVAIGDIIAEIDESATGGSSKAKSANGEAEKSSETTTQAVPPPPSTPAKMDESRHGPAATRLMAEKGINPNDIKGTGKDGRVTKGDVLAHGNSVPTPAPSAKEAKAPMIMPSAALSTERKEWREPMSMLRRRIAERLKSAQDTAALLTTFNEVDMTEVLAVRQKYKDMFKERYGVNLGFMSFFVKAACEALQLFPKINGWIEGDEIVYHNYCDVGVAVSTPKGLVVPVVRDADKMSFAEVELKIMDYAVKARDGKISLDDLSGGTFTVSNGGVFGSLMSTPIINPPQSAILGMHKTQEKPVALNGEVVIRPMMYLALSYDHRIVDGKEAVQFLVKIKECIEDPTRLLLGV